MTIKIRKRVAQEMFMLLIKILTRYLLKRQVKYIFVELYTIKNCSLCNVYRADTFRL